MAGFLRKLLGENKSTEEQFEVIISEIDDSPNKLFIWQFPDFTDDELEDVFEDDLRDMLEYDMKSHHVLVSGQVDVDELLVEEGVVIKERDSLYRKIKEREDDNSA